LNIRHISDEIGQASGLKMCFASTTKGFFAILTQSFTTAAQLGVLDELKTLLGEMYPATLNAAENGVPIVPPKAYRWVAEMQEIAATFSEEAGFEKDLFLGVSEVYKTMTDDTVLGQEKTGYRKRGRTVDDVAIAMNEGLQAKKKKSE
jgi:3-hydroxyisobutyrate dehydrogenase-like beta-hydroxyacid dehydrogenase